VLKVILIVPETSLLVVGWVVRWVELNQLVGRAGRSQKMDRLTTVVINGDVRMANQPLSNSFFIAVFCGRTLSVVICLLVAV